MKAHSENVYYIATPLIIKKQKTPAIHFVEKSQTRVKMKKVTLYFHFISPTVGNSEGYQKIYTSPVSVRLKGA